MDIIHGVLLTVGCNKRHRFGMRINTRIGKVFKLLSLRLTRVWFEFSHNYREYNNWVTDAMRLRRIGKAFKLFSLRFTNFRLSLFHREN